MTDRLTNDERQIAVGFMTTEQFTLQTARATTTNEANGRSALFLSTLSSALVALGFVAQTSEFGQAFSLFALLVLPPIAFLGVITFQRVTQNMLEDVFYAQALVRIRGLYVELVPAMRPYFLQEIDEHDRSSFAESIAKGRWQMALTVGAAIAVINCVLIGAIMGIAVNVALAPTLLVIVPLGVLTSVAAFVAHYRYQVKAWAKTDVFLLPDST